jgi:hypothetical protein
MGNVSGREDNETYVPDIVGTLSESSGHARPGDNIQSVDYLVPDTAKSVTASRTASGRMDPTDESFIPEVANPLTARMHKGINTTADEGQTAIPVGFNWQNAGGYGKANEGLGITEDGTGPLQSCQHPAVAFKPSHYTRDKDGAPSEVCPPLSADADRGDQEPVAFTASERSNSFAWERDYHGALNGQMTSDESNLQMGVRQGMQVRRLTPTECERLQGFPDGYTMIAWRGKEPSECPDGPRYRALGNSMAVPVMRWIGERIDAEDRRRS